MKNRVVGYLIIGIALLIGLIIFLFNRAMTDIVNSSCSHGASCPMWGTINFQTNVSIAIMAFIMLIGVFLVFFGEDEKVIVKIRRMKETKPKKDYKKTLSTLLLDDRKIFESIINSKGNLMQSTLVRTSGFGKVKVTRILNRLESRGLIERKRKGMSNVVILKE